MKKKTHIVIGLGFGDEGKGVTTDYLCSISDNPLVVRFSGGHQAGHTVQLPNGTRHVFSSFGSGTLRHIPTYWSSYCTLYPLGFMREYEALCTIGYTPKIYVDALAMITTPYDLAFNRATEMVNKHGSCGIGFSATVERSLASPYKFYMKDTVHESVLRHKLHAVSVYYEQKLQQMNKPDITAAYREVLTKVCPDIDFFIEFMYDVREKITIVTETAILQKYDTIIFEGSQGILLDQDHGFFPHATRAYTTSKNAMEMVQRNNLPTPSIYYITRIYQTRHGNGPMTNEDIVSRLVLQNTEQETNQQHEWQGTFRRTPLDADLLNYALLTDSSFAEEAEKHLVITCLDQIVGDPIITQNSETIQLSDISTIGTYVNAVPFSSILLNNGGRSDTMNPLLSLVAV